MVTKSVSFIAKIRHLQDYQLRLSYNMLPCPTGLDIANCLKYFSQVLLTMLKEVSKSPHEMILHPEMDATRLALYPTLDYTGLYSALESLLHSASSINTGLQAFGEAFNQCVACLVPFLGGDTLESLPYMIATAFQVLPSSVHHDLINTLCYFVIPFTIPRNKCMNNAALSVAGILLLVFQNTFDTALHLQLVERLMTFKKNIKKDLLVVIAYGTSVARYHAARLLFNYWPLYNANKFDRNKPKSIGNWLALLCQKKNCPKVGYGPAERVCLNHELSMKHAENCPPPFYLCTDCAEDLHNKKPSYQFHIVLQPLLLATWKCEYQECKSQNTMISVTCFSPECASMNNNRPIRLCSDCNKHIHSENVDHIVHWTLKSAGELDNEMQTYLVESIVSLLKEVRPPISEATKESQTKAAVFGAKVKGTMSSSKTDKEDEQPEVTINDRQLMGRTGVWLLVALYRIEDQEPPRSSIMGRLLSILFHWFHVTAYSYDDQQECTLEYMKTEYIGERWLKGVRQHYFEAFVNCLLPCPPEYAQVGGNWDMLASQTALIKNGLNQLLCLVPYDIVTSEIWELIMPHWLEAIVRDVPPDELPELRMLLCKILDSDMNPLGFDATKLYNFIGVRFKGTSAKVQEQALTWIQVLTSLEIIIPIHLLFNFFKDGLDSLKKIYNHENIKVSDFVKSNLDPVIIKRTESVTDDEDKQNYYTRPDLLEDDLKLSCCVLMLDITSKQMELHGIERHTGFASAMNHEVCKLITNSLVTGWFTESHKDCESKMECISCELIVLWHQLASSLVEYISLPNLAHPPDDPIIEECFSDDTKKTPTEVDKKESKCEGTNLSFMLTPDTIGGLLVNMPQLMTATVETVVEQLDLTPVMPAIARAITLTESDVGVATARVAQAKLMNEYDEPIDESVHNIQDFWQTAQGRFRIKIDELPDQLQLVYHILKEFPKTNDTSFKYYLLQSLHLVVLHCDTLTKAVKEHRGFVIWCQENLIIKNIWDCIEGIKSHLCEVAIPVMLHCLSLPCGSDIFWKLIKDEFHSSDWRTRFNAVEKVVLISRFVDNTPLRNNPTLQSCITNAFCYLLSSMDDRSTYVATRATLLLPTIHDSALKNLIHCMEMHFDTVMIDRPMILQSLYQLHNTLNDRKILSWEFFLGRFDALFIEAQIQLKKSGDITHVRDLRNSDITSDSFIKKVQRAHESMASSSESNCVRTLSASFGQKWPYKRTMSAPASTLTKNGPKHNGDKVYNRQFSAPILKRKTSQLITPILSILPDHSYGMDSHEDNASELLQKVVDLEESDKETSSLIVFLLMQYMSRPEHAYPEESKHGIRVQGIVLQHLYLLLGYNYNEKGFIIPPDKLRVLPVFNSFLSNLPQMLDQNFTMGHIIAPTALLLLQYCPSPETHSINATYSLWFLEPMARKSWLMSVMVYLYKYNFDKEPVSLLVVSLMEIVLNTLNAQQHVCNRIPPTVVMPDASKTKVEKNGESLYMESQKLYESQPSTSRKYPTSMETHWEEDISFHKRTPHKQGSTGSTEPDETESDLAIAPEKYKSDSTTGHYSSHGSFDESVDETFNKKAPLRSFWSNENNVDKTDKWGVKEGMKMLATSAIISVANQQNFLSQPILGTTSTSSPEINTTLKKSEEIIDVQKKQTTFYNPKDISQTSTSSSSVTSHPPIVSNIKDKILLQKPTLKSYNCPQSPLSKMKVHKNSSFSKESTTEIQTDLGFKLEVSIEKKPLEIPVQERLLPIGTTINLVQKMNKTFGLGDIDSASQSSSLNREDSSEKEQKNLHSPRKLTKQSALDSPEDNKSSNLSSARHSMTHGNDSQKSFNYKNIHTQNVDSPIYEAFSSNKNVSNSTSRIGIDCIQERCSDCGTRKEEYSDDEIGLCIVLLGTFVHRAPSVAACLLPEILTVLAKCHSKPTFLWQKESQKFLPCGSTSIAKKFLRCILYQLAPNGVFTQIFQMKHTENNDNNFFKSIIQALMDFNEMNPIEPLQMVLEVLNSKKSLSTDDCCIILSNITYYIDILTTDTISTTSTLTWTTILNQFDTLFRKIQLTISSFENINLIFKLMIIVLKIPGIISTKSILDPFSKILTYALQQHYINYYLLVDLCSSSYKTFAREREKTILTRAVTVELIQALKFKTQNLNNNLLVYVSFILQDIGGILPECSAIDNIVPTFPAIVTSVPTGASELLRNNLQDILDFLTDFNTLTKLKSRCTTPEEGINEDTFGSTVKAGMSQYLSLELLKSNTRDARSLHKIFPWLYYGPNEIQTIGLFIYNCKDFSDCLSHIRLLSWILIGSLSYTTMQNRPCLPLSQDVSCQIADHINVIMTGFAEESKSSVIHMSSLFHAFVLCQLWTIYMEQTAQQMVTAGDHHSFTMNILHDFWNKVTQSMLNLSSKSKSMGEMVNLHFLSLLEALLECRTVTLCKLIPMWKEVLFTDKNIKLPGHMKLRLDTCIDFEPREPPTMKPRSDLSKSEVNLDTLKWLQTLQFKMAQIELQSSQVNEFYNV
ncbi:unnamed protein product [Aphis gossypii]|uniref:Uncharacterized protein n=1 Tax=Aphis gossypii TaxID=80765 RepID=A0A9P0IQR6_APHGO|nr:unnamed protein product [Aphis gossypii]